MSRHQIFLIITAIGLLPIAFSYGLVPEKSLHWLFGLQVDSLHGTHIFRAVMCLYISLSTFWLLGAFKSHLRQAALYSLVFFMIGLGAGRVLSLLIDGIPNAVLLLYLGLEVVFGAIGVYLLGQEEK